MRLLAFALLLGCGGRGGGLDGHWLLAVDGLPCAVGSMELRGAPAVSGTFSVCGYSGRVAGRLDGNTLSLTLTGSMPSGEVLVLEVADAIVDPSLISAPATWNQQGSVWLVAERASMRWGKSAGPVQPDTCTETRTCQPRPQR